jgi:hypothetical protein
MDRSSTVISCSQMVTYRPMAYIDLGQEALLVMSKLSVSFLLIVSLLAMAGLGMLILILITDLSNLVISTHNPGMSR